MYDENYEKRKQLISKVKSEYWDSWKKGMWYSLFYIVSNIAIGLLLFPIMKLMPEEKGFNYCLVLLIVFLLIITPANGFAIKIFMRLMSSKEQPVKSAPYNENN